MTKTVVRQNLKSGGWAVALVGYRGWRRDLAIGDGITSAFRALLTRCQTRDEAERLTTALNNEEPAVLPGSTDARVFESLKYHRDDYISSQDLRNGSRDQYRRIALAD